MGGGASKSSSQGATSGMSAQQGSSTGNGNTIPTGQPSDPNGLEPVNRARHNEGEDMSGPPDRLGSGPMEDIDDRSRGNLGSSSEEMGYKGGGDSSDLADILQENTKETVSVAWCLAIELSLCNFIDIQYMYVKIYSVTLFQRKIINSCYMYLELPPLFFRRYGAVSAWNNHQWNFLFSIHYLSIHSNTGESFLCTAVVKRCCSLFYFDRMKFLDDLFKNSISFLTFSLEQDSRSWGRLPSTKTSPQPEIGHFTTCWHLSGRQKSKTGNWQALKGIQISLNGYNSYTCTLGNVSRVFLYIIH